MEENPVTFITKPSYYLFFISICVLIVLALFKFFYFLCLYVINDLICTAYS